MQPCYTTRVTSHGIPLLYFYLHLLVEMWYIDTKCITFCICIFFSSSTMLTQHNYHTQIFFSKKPSKLQTVIHVYFLFRLHCILTVRPRSQHTLSVKQSTIHDGYIRSVSVLLTNNFFRYKQHFICLRYRFPQIKRCGLLDHHPSYSPNCIR